MGRWNGVNLGGVVRFNLSWVSSKGILEYNSKGFEMNERSSTDEMNA